MWYRHWWVCSRSLCRGGYLSGPAQWLHLPLSTGRHWPLLWDSHQRVWVITLPSWLVPWSGQWIQVSDQLCVHTLTCVKLQWCTVLFYFGWDLTHYLQFWSLWDVSQLVKVLQKFKVWAALQVCVWAGLHWHHLWGGYRWVCLAALPEWCHMHWWSQQILLHLPTWILWHTLWEW